jgi:hypothetical protein
MKMKRISALLLAVIMALSLAACGSNPNAPQESASPDPAASPDAVQTQPAADGWQLFYDYLTKKGSIESADGDTSYTLQGTDNTISVTLDFKNDVGAFSYVLALTADAKTAGAAVTATAHSQILTASMEESASGTLNCAEYQDGAAFEWAKYDISGVQVDGTPIDSATAVGLLVNPTKNVAETVLFLQSALQEASLDVTMADLGFLAYAADAPASSAGGTESAAPGESSNVLVDNETIKISALEKFEDSYRVGYKLMVENKSATKYLLVRADNTSVNGLMTFVDIQNSSIAPGKKAKAELCVYTSDENSDIKTLDDFVNIEGIFTFSSNEDGSNSYRSDESIPSTPFTLS